MIKRIVNAFESRRYRFLNSRLVAIPKGTSIVSFTFDDFPESAATIGAALLEQHGWRGTYYLSPGLMGESSAVGEISSLATAENILKTGHEIGNHTYSHFRCSSAKKKILRQDIEKSESALLKLNGSRNFALPFGAHDASALNVLSGRFDTIRTVEPGVNRGVFDLNLLKANRIYQSSDINSLKLQVKDVSINGGWLIFYTHDICKNPSDFGCTEVQFEELLNSVSQCSVEVLTIEEGFKRIM